MATITATPKASRRVKERLKRHGNTEWTIEKKDLYDGVDSVLCHKNNKQYYAWFPEHEVVVNIV